VVEEPKKKTVLKKVRDFQKEYSKYEERLKQIERDLMEYKLSSAEDHQSPGSHSRRQEAEYGTPSFKF